MIRSIRDGRRGSTGCSFALHRDASAGVMATRWRRCSSSDSKRPTARVAAARVWAAAVADLLTSVPRAFFRRRDRPPGIPEERHNIMLGSDLRYTLRWLVRQKFSSALVVAMLTIGIAANIVVFSLVSGLFLRPFPFPHADRLIYINETAPRWNLEVVGINFRTSTTGRRARSCSRRSPSTTPTASTSPTTAGPNASKARSSRRTLRRCSGSSHSSAGCSRPTRIVRRRRASW